MLAGAGLRYLVPALVLVRLVQEQHFEPAEALDCLEQSIVNGTYEMRGLEVTLQGGIEARDGGLLLAGHGQRPPVRLAPLPAGEKIKWDHTKRQRKPLEPDEALAYDRLVAASAGVPSGQPVSVTGPLKETDGGYELHVRLFQV